MDGNVIWEWNIADHLIQDINPDLPNYGVIKDHPEKLDPNYGSGRRADWIHTNSFDYNEVLDQVVINNSEDSEFYVIDHGATFIPGNSKKSIELAASDVGDFLFRWGNPSVYDSGEAPSMKADGTAISEGHQQIFFTHDVQWIREKEVTPLKGGLPGAGNFLIFDNGHHPTGHLSSVIEINPYKGDWKKGIYVPEAEAGYAQTRGHSPQNVSKQIAWSFNSTLSNSFSAFYISGAQRLPNGNTLIDSGPHGHLFEVTTEGEVVWEYINPVGDRTDGQYGIYKTMVDDAGGHFNPVFRAARYAPDYPGLAGKDLTPQGKITEIYSKAPVKDPAKPTAPYVGKGGPGDHARDAFSAAVTAK
jgi:hypothetical protein